MPREEIVRRALVRGEIPLYGAAAAAGTGAAAKQQDDTHGMARGGAAQADDDANALGRDSKLVERIAAPRSPLCAAADQKSAAAQFVHPAR
jgi:hypothetical protein